jgi:hypothetical protein
MWLRFTPDEVGFPKIGTDFDGARTRDVVEPVPSLGDDALNDEHPAIGRTKITAQSDRDQASSGPRG